MEGKSHLLIGTQVKIRETRDENLGKEKKKVCFYEYRLSSPVTLLWMQNISCVCERTLYKQAGLGEGSALQTQSHLQEGQNILFGLRV